jgi:hypothetical protein
MDEADKMRAVVRAHAAAVLALDYIAAGYGNLPEPGGADPDLGHDPDTVRWLRTRLLDAIGAEDRPGTGEYAVADHLASLPGDTAEAVIRWLIHAAGRAVEDYARAHRAGCMNPECDGCAP